MRYLTIPFLARFSLRLYADGTGERSSQVEEAHSGCWLTVFSTGPPVSRLVLSRVPVYTWAIFSSSFCSTSSSQVSHLFSLHTNHLIHFFQGQLASLPVIGQSEGCTALSAWTRQGHYRYASKTHITLDVQSIDSPLVIFILWEMGSSLYPGCELLYVC